MLRQLMEEAASRLRESGTTHVYSAFDAVDIQKKTRSIFTVIDVSSFESSTPIYSLTTVYLPFKAELLFRVTAPECWTMEQLYEYFDQYIAPAVETMSDMNCSLRSITLKPDSNINRLVMNVRISAGGVIKTERSTI
ncbi:MAG: hypothetical protein IJK31_00790 [Ruminococcus sp.]|nr:hypothetical protein [Ruminococcus sp.]